MAKGSKRTKHHRHPKSRIDSYEGNINEPSNISMVRNSDHVHFHAIFGNMLPREIAAMLTDAWICRKWYMVAVPRKKKKPKPKRVRRYCTDCSAEVLKHITQTKKDDTS